MNVDAVWHMTHEVATRWTILQEQAVVFFLGFSPRRGIPMMAHSSMARSALETLAASLSNEWSRFGIRAVCIAAGLIETEGLQQYGSVEVLAGHAAQVQIAARDSAEEVDATIAFLASAGGAYVHGVDRAGGRTRRCLGARHAAPELGAAGVSPSLARSAAFTQDERGGPAATRTRAQPAGVPAGG